MRIGILAELFYTADPLKMEMTILQGRAIFGHGQEKEGFILIEACS
jgi:hypothetical protein